MTAEICIAAERHMGIRTSLSMGSFNKGLPADRACLFQKLLASRDGRPIQLAMVQMKVVYEGGLHCRLTHGPSGAQIVTDAPKDNMGKGEAFSPTDLASAALGSCMLTLMGIFADRHQIALTGAQAEVSKEMADNPRRIARIAVTLHLPKGIPPAHRPALERTALTCPVHKSLHPDIQVPVQFQYPD